MDFLNPDLPDKQVLQSVLDFYHAAFKSSPKARAYMAKRGLIRADAAAGDTGAASTIDALKLGYADRSLGKLLPSKDSRPGRVLRDKLSKLGVIKAKTGHETLRGSLVIPFFDIGGGIVNLYGRKITPTLRKGTPLHVYICGQQGIWNISALTSSEEIIVADSPLNALTFWCHGIQNIVSTAHAGINDEMLRALREHGTKRVLLAFRRTDKQDNGLLEAVARMVDMGISVYRLTFPAEMDANDFIAKRPDPAQALTQVIHRAEWVAGGEKGVVENKEHAPGVAGKIIPPPTVSPVLPATSDVKAEINGDEIIIVLGDRRYRARGLLKNTSYEHLRVNLLVNTDLGFHVDTINLYSAKHRASYAKMAADELFADQDAIKKDLGAILLKLEEIQDQNIKAALAPKNAIPIMEEHEEEEARTLLSDSRLIERILMDFDAFGVVGERTNKLVAYLAATSRKLDDPLAIIVQSTSAAGKSSLMEAVLSFFPEEDVHKYSAMTGQSLYYLGEDALKHRILAIAEEEGAEKASYALKLLQSEGELRIASTSKDATGRMVTETYHVTGPVMLFQTSTAIDLDEELLNRCIVLTVNEDREQTRAIHQSQRMGETLEGLLAKRDRRKIVRLHRNAQRLLRPLLVVNPYATFLTFADSRTRMRRDHKKYLSLIRAIALLHQCQREIKSIEHKGETVHYIEVAPADITLANSLAHEVLGRSLDELSPQTRRMLEIIQAMVADACDKKALDQSDYRFSRRQIRAVAGWSDYQVRCHMKRLCELEYLLVHRGKRGQSYVYELLYDGNAGGNSHFSGLLDPGKLINHQKNEHDSGQFEHTKSSESADLNAVLSSHAVKP